MNDAAASPSAAPEPQAPADAALEARPGRRDLAVLAGLLLAFGLIRGVVFPFAENLYGDAVVRSEIAEKWARDPHVIRSFKDGVYQFGPAHFYYMGTLLEAWPSREHATRFASLLMGLLLIVPVYRLGKRLFSRRAAVATALAIAVWGLHIQASTTAASEALFLTLFFFALDAIYAGVETGRMRSLMLAALLVNVACATRYDGWMYVPLLGVTIALSGKDRIASVTRAVVFLMLCAPFPLWWMQQNERATGDALYPLHFINQYHLAWAQAEAARLGGPVFRAMALFFWPGTLLATTSLLVGVFALAGMVQAFRTRTHRGLALLAIVPAVYYTVRGAVLVDFSPIARFAMVQVALALFYVKDGFDLLCGRWSPRARRAMAVGTGALALATTLWLGWFTAWKDGGPHEALRPISPLSTIPTWQRAAADYLRQHVGPDETVILDQAPGYVDLHIGYFSGLPEERLAPRRWEDFEQRLARAPKAPWLVAAYGGAFAQEGLRVGEPTVSWRGRTWQRVAAPSSKLTIYRAQ